MHILGEEQHQRTERCDGARSIALPMLDAVQPPGISNAAKAPPMRMVCIGNPLGMLPEALFPTTIGSGYAIPGLLRPLEKHRKDFMIFFASRRRCEWWAPGRAFVF